MTKFNFNNINIDSNIVKEFFNSKNLDSKNSLSTVNLQKNEQLAKSRDIYEKKLIVPLLNLTSKEKTLEIGCGIGRFVPAIIEKVKNYLGLDFSEQLIKLAQNNFLHLPKAKFQVMSATTINNDQLITKPTFNLIMTMGLMMYLNDDDCDKLVDKIMQLSNSKCTLYLRESVSILGKRATLKNFYSKELKNDYNAIYRTKDEYMHWFDKFTKNGFKLTHSDFLLKNELVNRTETNQHFWIFKNH